MVLSERGARAYADLTAAATTISVAGTVVGLLPWWSAPAVFAAFIGGLPAMAAPELLRSYLRYRAQLQRPPADT